ncbi:MAG: nicotinate-nucleotide--dimethylbenzimidazole phosphoribosyltransferase [Kiritimatiellae bacterium]|nr:nicotinate-nucleotide--dimethylbenzimidazole phosphoribosyltransferase [Kiritimatiellia bacterium]
MNAYRRTLNSIRPPDHSLEPSIRAHLDDLTKPQGSLGRLEELALQYCLVQGTDRPKLGAKRVCCLAGDHGVADEGVSAFPKEVTPQMVHNMLAGGAAVNVLTRHVNAQLTIVDMGVATPMDNAPGLCRRRIRGGTDNIAVGPAMTRDEVEAALSAGIELAEAAAAEGVTMLGSGDMGIANTTPATALLAAYLGCPVEEITGRGTGIDDQRLAHKIAVIKRALEINRDSLADATDALAALGGFEIAGIAGLMLGAAAKRLPMVVDGFISTAGAAAACAICPPVREYLIFSHLSHERGHRAVVKALRARPVLELDMRLGEGTGAALAMTIVEAGVKIYNEMATFSGAAVSTKQS